MYLLIYIDISFRIVIYFNNKNIYIILCMYICSTFTDQPVEYYAIYLITLALDFLINATTIDTCFQSN